MHSDYFQKPGEYKVVRSVGCTKSKREEKVSGEVDITIDYEKYETDNVWDGLKGHFTSTHLP